MKQEDINKHLSDIKSHLITELSKIRTGRANTNIVESIKVDAYDGAAPLTVIELGAVSIPDPQSILIVPWDKTVIKKIEDAILKANLGLSPMNDGTNIRVPIPALTEERRKELAKSVGHFLEDARIKVRNVRQNAIKSIEEQADEGVISEDDMFRQKKMIEDLITKSNKDLEEISTKKETELLKG